MNEQISIQFQILASNLADLRLTKKEHDAIQFELQTLHTLVQQQLVQKETK